jgi:transcriptional regulator with XRE-family HTH domain
MPKTKRAKTVTEQLRQAIDASGQSRYAICKALGIDQAHLSRFMAGDCGLSMDTLDALCEYLGLELKRKGK